MDFVDQLDRVIRVGKFSDFPRVPVIVALALTLGLGAFGCGGPEGLRGEVEAGSAVTASAATELVAASSRSAAKAACAGDPGIGSVGFREARGVAEVQAHPWPGTLYLALGLDDEAIAARVHAYDGSSERAFACVPLHAGPYGESRYERIDLPWVETVEREGRRVDVHRTAVPVTARFAKHAWTHNRGVYFGVETAGGVVWAQGPGEDHIVTTVTDRSPTLRPLPEAARPSP